MSQSTESPSVTLDIAELDQLIDLPAERTESADREEAVDEPRTVELSVVMPCLNEAETLGTCLEKAKRAIDSHGVVAEIIVADNGSTDGSIEIAEQHGARVVHVAEKGYGSALMGGIEASRGKYVIMGDADDSYDFGEIPAILTQLRLGNDLVQGCRLPSGGGTVMPGAMPFLHRWWGNPMFSRMARGMFGTPVHDVYCGLRGFTRAHYDRLALRCTGMEFATEMIVKSSLFGARIAEVPITLHPDGRQKQVPHLRTFRDGWRTLRLFLLYSPRWLFHVPGLLLVVLGMIGFTAAMSGTTIGAATLGAHTLLVSSLAVLVGFQCIQLAVFAKTFGVSEGMLPVDKAHGSWMRYVTPERGMIAGVMVSLAGIALLGVATWQWWQTGFGPLDYARSMRIVVPGTMLSLLGVQTVLGSFLLALFGMRRK